MPPIALYLLKCSISLSITWLFYRLVLRNLTFYGLNRWYLLGYSLFSFLIPFIDIAPIVPKAAPQAQPFYIQFIPVVGDNAQRFPASRPAVLGFSTWNVLLALFFLGMIVLLTRTIIRWGALTRIKRKARLISSEAGIDIYRVDLPINPFSFGHAIYINPRLHSEKEWEEIILHEWVHIRQRHTVDILLIEAVCILNWFNPFAWALRHSIRQNLEVIADEQVLNKGVDKKEYQYHLLRVVGHPRYRLANNFNFSSLKKRIIMMNKIRSARLHLLRFLFLLPLLTVLLLAFRTRYPDLLPHRERSVFADAGGVPGPRVAPTISPDTVPKTAIRVAPRIRPDTESRASKPDISKALYILDGELMDHPINLNDTALNAAEISSVNILSTEEAFRIFGERGRYGAIAVLTKKYLDTNKPPMALSYNVDQGGPLYIIDGTRLREGFNWMALLNPDNIASMIVLKNKAAVARYGPDGKRGVIVITTKTPLKKP